MSELNFLKMYADAAALRIDVLVNRLDCNTALERALHDYLENFLAQFITYTREGLAAERRFVLNTDPAKVAELDEDFGNHRENYEYYWREPKGAGLWEYVPFEMKEFRLLLGEIERKLGILIDAIGLELPQEEHPVSAPPFVEHNPDDIDDECYEDLHGYDEGEEFSAIYLLVNGDDHDSKA
ncbi:MAG: hypothetical protein QHC90_08915 [Shinella sp.]|nr:hypothetical protein [Shinella sp.]